MIGVRFTQSMAPYGIGDTALLPEEVAQDLVDGGSAELYEFPKSPHASAALAEAPADKSMQAMPASEQRQSRQTYRTKKG